MEKYKARENSSYDENKSSEEIEKEQKQESTAKAVDVAGTMAADYFTGGKFSQAKDSLSNIPVVGDKVNEAWNDTVNKVAEPLAKTPVGDIAKGLDDVGITDTVGNSYKALTSMNGNGGGDATIATNMNKNNLANNLGSNPNNSPSEGVSDNAIPSNLNIQNSTEESAGSNESVASGKSDNIFSFDISSVFTKNFKIKLLLCIGIPFFFLMVILVLASAKDYENLFLTNTTVLSSTYTMGQNCTTSEVNEKLVYVGDKRLDDLKNVSNVENITFLTSTSADYNWLSSTINSEITNNDSTKKIYVFSIGYNDIYNINNYYSYFSNLISSNNTIDFYFLSINPVNESIVQNISNSDIYSFNQQMKNIFSSKFIDTNTNLTFNILDDGSSYSSETNKAIHDYVTSNVLSTSNLSCSGGSIGDLSNSSMAGGSAEILSLGESILSKIGQEKLDEWNSKIKNDVYSKFGTGTAPALAAYDLIQGALDYGFVVPYLWGGGHGVISDGINGNWGASATVTASGSSAQPAGSKQANGLDCSGFVSWALKNGGCTNFSPIIGREFRNLGSAIKASDAKTGDVAANTSHVMIILKNTGSSLIVAEAKGKKYGIQFNNYDYSQFNKYTVVDMSSYYSQYCKG